MFALQRTSYHMWCCNISVAELSFVTCVVKSHISLIQDFRHSDGGFAAQNFHLGWLSLLQKKVDV